MPHSCHATGCSTGVSQTMWGCKKHWFMVPRTIRDRVWTHYRPGQEDDWMPTREYLYAARDAVIAVAGREGIIPDTSVYDMFLEEPDDAEA